MTGRPYGNVPVTSAKGTDLIRIVPLNPLHLPALILFLASFQASPAAATSARIAALGGRGDFFTDEANVHRWCAVLGEYPGLVTLESGWIDLDPGDGGDGRDRFGPGGGISLGIGPAGTWATVGLSFHDRQSGSDPGSLVPEDGDDAFTAMAARRFGDLLAGLRYRRVGRTWDDPLAGSWNAERRELGAGVRVPLGSAGFLDLAGEIRGLSSDLTSVASPTATPFVLPEDSWGNPGLRARAFLPLGPSSVLVPVLEYAEESGSTFAAEDGALQPATFSARLTRTGLGFNFFPDLDTMLLVSVEYLDARRGGTDWPSEGYPDDPLTLRSYPLTLRSFLMRSGVEWRLAPMVVARAGFGLATQENALGGDRQPLYLGLSGILGDTTLDLAVRNCRTGSGILEAGERSTRLTIVLRHAFQP